MDTTDITGSSNLSREGLQRDRMMIVNATWRINIMAEFRLSKWEIYLEMSCASTARSERRGRE